MNNTPLQPGLYLITLTTLISELECVAVTLVHVPDDLPFEITASEANAFAAYSYHHHNGELETFSLGRPTFESESGFLVYPDDIDAMPVDVTSFSAAARDAMRGVTYDALHLNTCKAVIDEYLQAFDADDEDSDESDEE